MNSMKTVITKLRKKIYRILSNVYRQNSDNERCLKKAKKQANFIAPFKIKISTDSVKVNYNL